MDFDSEELIRKAIEYIDRELYVSRLQYTVTYAGQKDVLSADMVREGSSFSDAKSRTKKLEHDYAGQVAYDLIGKIAEGTTLTRHTVARILQGIKPTTFAMYQNNPEEFIAKVIRLVKEQKATMIVEHITYDTIEGSYDSSIFTAEKHALTMDKAYKAQKAIQDYVFTDGTAERAWNGSLRKIWTVQRKSLSMQNCRKASIFRPRLDTTPRTGQSCSMRAR